MEGWTGEGLPPGWIGKALRGGEFLNWDSLGKRDAGNKYGFIYENGSTFVGKNRAIAYLTQLGRSRYDS